MREFSTTGDNSVSYTHVIIPTVDGPVDNSGMRVWMTVWKVWTIVENRRSGVEERRLTVLSLWRALRRGAPDERRRPPYLLVRRASEVRCGGYRHRVVMRNPMNMIPKPIRMFHEPSDGTGSVVFEM